MTKHLLSIAAITAFLALVIVHPYFSGRHDPLAGRLSALVQPRRSGSVVEAHRDCQAKRPAEVQSRRTLIA